MHCIHCGWFEKYLVGTWLKHVVILWIEPLLVSCNQQNAWKFGLQALCCPALEKKAPTCNVDSHHPLVFVLDTQPQDVLTKLRQAPVCTDFHSSKYLTTADLESKLTLDKVVEVT